jgi:hypothetical protein
VQALDLHPIGKSMRYTPLQSRQTPVIIPVQDRGMKQITFVALIAVLAAEPAPSDEGVRIRYTDSTSRLEITVEQDISVEGHPSIAGRSLFFDLDLIQAGSRRGLPPSASPSSGPVEPTRPMEWTVA